MNTPCNRFRSSRCAVLWMLGGLALSLSALSAGAAAPAEGRAARTALADKAGVVLAGDERLAQRVTLRFGKTPLHRVLAEVERQTRVPVSVEAELKDEPVVVYVKEQPASAVMEQIATLLGWTWSRTGSGEGRRYQLLRGAAAQKREAELFRQRHLQMGKAVQSALEWRLRLAVRPAAELEALADQLTAVRTKPPQDLTEEDRRLLRSEDAVRTARVGVAPLRESAAPVWRTLTRVAGELSASHWEALMDGEIFWFSTRPLPRTQLLRPEREREFQAGRPTLAALEQRFNVDPTTAQILNEATREREEKWEAANGFCCRVEWVNGTPDWSTATLRLEVSALPKAVDQPPTSGAVLEIRTAEAGPAEKLPLPPQHDTEPNPQLDAARTWRNPKFLPAPRGSGTVDWLSQMLPHVAEIYGVNLIADGYRHQDRGFRAPQEGASLTLREVLDRSAYPLADWHQDGEFLRIRRREWFHARWVEPAASQVEAWEKRLRERPVVMPQDLLLLHTTRKEEQVSGLSDALGDRGITFPMPLLMLFPGSRAALRAVGSLPPLLRAELRKGAELSGDRLPPAFLHQLQRAEDQSSSSRLVPQPSVAKPSLTIRLFEMEYAVEEGAGPGFRVRRTKNDLDPKVLPRFSIGSLQQDLEKLGIRSIPEVVLSVRSGSAYTYSYFFPLSAAVSDPPATGAAGSQ